MPNGNQIEYNYAWCNERHQNLNEDITRLSKQVYKLEQKMTTIVALSSAAIVITQLLVAYFKA